MNQDRPGVRQGTKMEAGDTGMQAAGHRGRVIDIHEFGWWKSRRGKAMPNNPLLTAAVDPIADVHERGLALGSPSVNS